MIWQNWTVSHYNLYLIFFFYLTIRTWTVLVLPYRIAYTCILIKTQQTSNITDIKFPRFNFRLANEKTRLLMAPCSVCTKKTSGFPVLKPTWQVSNLIVGVQEGVLVINE